MIGFLERDARAAFVLKQVPLALRTARRLPPWFPQCLANAQQARHAAGLRQTPQLVRGLIRKQAQSGFRRPAVKPVLLVAKIQTSPLLTMFIKNGAIRSASGIEICGSPSSVVKLIATRSF